MGSFLKFVGPCACDRAQNICFLFLLGPLRVIVLYSPIPMFCALLLLGWYLCPGFAPSPVLYFFPGDPPPPPPIFIRASIPFARTSMQLFTNSSVMSLRSGWPPSIWNLQSRQVQRPSVAFQHRKGRPLVCVNFGSVGKSVYLFPAASSISARNRRLL
jgi:hypothetical protein